MEYRDLYDENRNLTNEKIKKGDKIPKDRYYITVAVVIKNSKNEYLLQINKKYDKWCFTGGHPKSGETSVDGIITEIKEEIGIEILEDELTLLETNKTEDDFFDIYYLEKDIKLCEIAIDLNEVSDVKWFTVEEINEFIKNGLFLKSHIGIYNKFILKK